VQSECCGNANAWQILLLMLLLVLLQGSRYKPPLDNLRLLESLRVTLDFMGLPTPHFPCSNFHEVLMLPGYAPSPEEDKEHGGGSVGDEGLLMYSAATQGWAAVTHKDPRPQHVCNGCIDPDRRWLAGVLRSEYTSAGEAAGLIVIAHTSSMYCAELVR
jgi:hypothetical protein